MDFFLLDSFILQLYYRCNGWVVTFCLLANYNNNTFTVKRVAYHAFSDYISFLTLRTKIYYLINVLRNGLFYANHNFAFIYVHI